MLIVRIRPELPRHEFREIVQLSRISTLNRSPQRLQTLLEDSLDAIYSVPSNDSKLHTDEELSSELSHPFYSGIALKDALMVDKCLRDHEIPTINTRVVCHKDADAHAKVFTVIQAVTSGSESKMPTIATRDNDCECHGNTASDNHDGGDDGKPLRTDNNQVSNRVIQMPNRSQIHLVRGDYEPMLSRMVHEIFRGTASSSTSEDENESSHAHASPEMHQCLISFFETGDVENQNRAKKLWTRQNFLEVNPVAFLVGVFPLLPTSRDPLRSRGALESFLAIRNGFYHSRTQLVLKEHVSELLEVLPFSDLMNAEQYLGSVSVECVDLVLTGRRSSFILKLRQQYQRQSSDVGLGNSDSKPYKILFLANCMESYATGLVTKEKAELLEGFLSATICDLARDERDQVKYFQFLCEDVLSPATMVMLQAQDLTGKNFNHDKSQVAYLPPELSIVNGEDGDDDSTFKENSTMKPHAEWTQSSFARKATSWYAPGESYATRFAPVIASVLEECRRILIGLRLSLRRRVQQLVLSNWSSGSASSTTFTTESRSRQAQYRFGIAYWALVLRDALFALLFYSKQHFRWDDRSMQARFMVLQMMLYDENGSPEQYTKSNDDEVVELLTSFESASRNVNGVACSGAVVSMRLHFPVAPNELKWLEKAQLRSCTWLQKIQWLQITGDIQEGDDLYRKYSCVSDLFLQYREFLVSKLAPAAKDSMSTATAAVPKKASQLPSQQLHQTALDAHSKALAARTMAGALHNTSNFAHDTLWIPPVLQLSSIPSSEPTPADPRRQLERNESETDNLSEPLATSPSQQQCVVMRVFKPDLAQAIEAAVVTIGVINDDVIPSLSLKMGTQN